MLPKTSSNWARRPSKPKAGVNSSSTSFRPNRTSPACPTTEWFGVPGKPGRAGPRTDMMGGLLTTGISYCVCDDRAVFLDVERDRYFCLLSQLNQAFVRTVIDGYAMASAAAERLRALGIDKPTPREFAARQIGRASCRERVCQYV